MIDKLTRAASQNAQAHHANVGKLNFHVEPTGTGPGAHTNTETEPYVQRRNPQ